MTQRKKYGIIALICMLTLICIVVIKNIEKLHTILEDKKRTEIIDEFDYMIMDNSLEGGAKLKVVVVVKRASGIEEIEYNFNNTQSTVLQCNGKQEVAIDGIIMKDSDYEFKIKSGGEIKEEKLKITDIDVEKCLNLKQDENGMWQVRIRNILPTIPDYNYSYRFDESSEWKTAKNGIPFSPVEDFQLNVGNDTTFPKDIFFKAESDAGNTLLTKKSLQIEVSYYDVLDKIGHTQSSFDEFGVTVKNASGKTIAPSGSLLNFKFSRGTNAGSFRYYYYINWDKPKDFNATHMYCKLRVYAYSDRANQSNYGGATVAVKYKDGTEVYCSSYTETAIRKGELIESIEEKITNKLIDSGEINIYGADDNQNSSSAAEVQSWYLEKVKVTIID